MTSTSQRGPVRAARDDPASNRQTKPRRLAKNYSRRDPNAPNSSPPASPPHGLTPDRTRPRGVSFNLPSQHDHHDGDRSDEEYRLPHLGHPDPPPPPLYPRLPTRLNSAATRSEPTLPGLGSRTSETTSGRPWMPQRSASKPPLNVKSESLIDREIFRLVRKRAKASKAEGFNYVFETARDQDGQHIYKVGFSVTPDERLKAVKGGCKFFSVRELPEAVCRPIKRFALAEKLIQAELQNFKISETCQCGKRHKEYFKVPDRSIVLEAHWRWHSFCESEPWDSTGRLLPQWKYLLSSRPTTRDGCGQRGLAESWRAFTNPTPLQRLGWNFKCLWDQVRPHRYQFVAFSHAMAFLFLSSTHPLIRLYIMSLPFCIFLDSINLGHFWGWRPLPTAPVVVVKWDKCRDQGQEPTGTLSSIANPQDEDALMEVDDGTHTARMNAETGHHSPPNNKQPNMELPGAWNIDALVEESQELVEDDEKSVLGSCKENPLIIDD